MSAPVYTGNIPSNVAKEAKYSVVHGTRGMEIRLIYGLARGERVLVTTKAHPKLVKMVSDVKEEYRGAPGGAFYINEYGFVLVPANDSCYYAGQYDDLLEFEFEGRIISPKAPSGLLPGEVWPGPHVGVSYTLTADGQDVRYRAEVRPNVEKAVQLSDAVGRTGARTLARRLSKYKSGGGRIYINEAREFFAPTRPEDPTIKTYLGNLGEDEWFPRPTIVRG